MSAYIAAVLVQGGRCNTTRCVDFKQGFEMHRHMNIFIMLPSLSTECSSVFLELHTLNAVTCRQQRKNN